MSSRRSETGIDGRRSSPTGRYGPLRAVYEEYDAGSTRVGLIADPENEDAWIQSDRTVPVRE